MPHWLIKSATHRVISWLPNPQSWNYLLSKYLAKSTGINKGGFEYILGRGRRILENYRTYSPHPREDFTVLELGPGWHPIVPIAMYLCGASKIWLVDIVSLLRAEQTLIVFRFFSDAADSGELSRLLPSIRPERVAKLKEVMQSGGSRTPQQMLAELNIESLVADARHTPMPSGAADIIFSSSVLTHIPENIVPGILQDFRRLASPNAVMVHAVLLTDHFIRFDHKITEFNFLKYSRGAWRLLNSPIEYQSRYRVTDYRRLLNESGFQIVLEDNILGSKADLDSIKLDAEFQAYPKEDLLVRYTWLVSRPKPSTA